MTDTTVIKEYLATSVVVAPVAYILSKYVLKVKSQELIDATIALTLGYLFATKREN